MAELNYNEMMNRVRRERQTETKVRAMDACEIVAWIHDLEDEISSLQKNISDISWKVENLSGIVDDR